MNLGKFRLDRENGKAMGVCAGIAEHTGLDATLVRVAAVVLTIAGGFPWTLIAYGILAWVGQPAEAEASRGNGVATVRGGSTHDLKAEMRDIDRRLAEVDTYVAQGNTSLAREIEELR
jgi:phage shock protein C